MPINRLIFNFLKVSLKCFFFFLLCCILPYIFIHGVIGGFYPEFKTHVFGKAGLILFLVMIVAVHFSNNIY